VDELRSRRPHGLAVSQLPRALLESANTTAKDIFEAVRNGDVVATPRSPDRGLPESLPEWKQVVEKARIRPGTPSEPILRLNEPKKLVARTGAGGDHEERPAYPPDVETLSESYKLLCHVERLLRDRLHDVLSQRSPNYDADATIIPEAAQDSALAVIEGEAKAFGGPLSPRMIDYLEFGTIIEMVNTNWKLLEANGFIVERPRWELIKKDLPVLRNAVMHSRVPRKALRSKIEAIHFEVQRALRDAAVPSSKLKK
jgi:hypothetical protein